MSTFSVKACLELHVVSNFVPVSKEGDVKQHLPSKYSAPGEVFNTVWYADQMTHAVSVRYAFMSLVTTVLAMSRSVVRSMVVIT